MTQPLLDAYRSESPLRTRLQSAHVYTKVLFLLGMMASFFSDNWTKLWIYLVAAVVFAYIGDIRPRNAYGAYTLLVVALGLAFVADRFLDDPTADVARIPRYLLCGSLVWLTALAFRNLVAVREIAGVLRGYNIRPLAQIGTALAGAFHDFQTTQRTRAAAMEVARTKRNTGDHLSARIKLAYSAFQTSLLIVINSKFQHEFLLDSKGFDSNEYRPYRPDTLMTENDVPLFVVAVILLVLPLA